ncbi:DJ-1/PfpI family protein [Sphingomonas daechungensis]|uniref:DJ-1/PfpI family protein n=1 Tax=Sphingomonas daechungensis TaxID=1176646 RepID=A0ABX6T1T0_9SPHN|nr:DJ-1/PfpI family protein [Sphingomonas daechungensis]QNP43811.1 DJ-1/PfpI family protein [Sphingomonas daechungensis]
MSPIRVVFLVYPNVTQLDLTGPAQVLSRLPNAQVDLVWKSVDPVPTDSGFSLLPTATLDEVETADILCVPGGFGCVDVMHDDEALAWVRRVGGSAQWVTSVCTGSLILGAAGLLKGYRATSHWAWSGYLTLFDAEPVAERVVFDRNRVTGGGVTAGIDFALALTARIAGEEYARSVQLGIEYDPHPPFDSGTPDKAGATLVAKVYERSNRMAPDREKQIETAAIRLTQRS